MYQHKVLHLHAISLQQNEVTEGVHAIISVERGVLSPFVPLGFLLTL